MKTELALGLALLTFGCSNASSGADGGPNGDASHANLAIVVTNATPVVGGSALKLAVVIVDVNGEKTALPAGTKVTWLSPSTYVAADPNDAGSAALPAEAPLAFFIDNPFRTDRTDYDSVMFVVQRGTSENPNVTVSANVDGFGVVSDFIPVRDPLIGDPDAGAATYQKLMCGQCHGATGAGSPPETSGGTTYNLIDASYPYPAPPIYGGDGGTAADPAWNGSYFGLAAQGDIDNSGVALRSPMPDFLGMGSAQDFADIYAFLQTQPQ